MEHLCCKLPFHSVKYLWCGHLLLFPQKDLQRGSRKSACFTYLSRPFPPHCTRLYSLNSKGDHRLEVCASLLRINTNFLLWHHCLHILLHWLFDRGVLVVWRFHMEPLLNIWWFSWSGRTTARALRLPLKWLTRRLFLQKRAQLLNSCISNFMHEKGAFNVAFVYSPTVCYSSFRLLRSLLDYQIHDKKRRAWVKSFCNELKQLNIVRNIWLTWSCRIWRHQGAQSRLHTKYWSHADLHER